MCESARVTISPELLEHDKHDGNIVSRVPLVDGLSRQRLADSLGVAVLAHFPPHDLNHLSILKKTRNVKQVTRHLSTTNSTLDQAFAKHDIRYAPLVRQLIITTKIFLR